MKNHIKILTASVLLLIASACKVSKDIETPKEAIPAAYRSDVAASTSSATIADTDWRSFFTDNTLQTLVDSALVRNNDLLVAQQNIEIARLRLSQAKWGNVPTLNLQVTASSTNPSENSLNGLSLSQFVGQHHIDDFTAAGTLSWEADIWGKIKNRKKSALAQYLQSSEAKNALQTIIVSNVARGFYNLLMLDAQLEVARKNLELNERTLQIINLRYDSGQVTSLAKQQAEAQRLVAAQLIPFLEQQIAIQENALSVLTGSFPKTIDRKTSLAQLAVADKLDAGVPSQMVALRPDVKASELYLQQMNAEVGVTKAQLYPSLTISATAGVNSFEASNWFTMPASLFGTVAGGLTQPLLNGKRLRTQYEVSKAEREKAVIGFRQSVLVAVGEVSNALVSIDKLKLQYEAADSRKNTLQTAVKNADLLFKSGMANYLEVITAQDNLLQSELQVLVQKKARLDAAVELYRSLGGGWK
ncbi:efflux transporter outer membrane subunit [Flavobacterium sp. MAH-1]|uniref:Efflux transporter outer membrane subunit n=1 Tax=Flavobacterium agri TaxID=2743471 RepID=A0A7Y9C8A6_9FLAO|nr:efflux transporter outer membrane subunit [Flavobacterium agri]NUY82188.1 efflux transporter outer membrane subunit [Flavobacterium agri]NYA72212.1 efflux transporter outer membrane subunit [Flavobacterium agri]